MKLPFKTDSVAQKVSVKSAVNGSLWACAVITVPLSLIATMNHGAVAVTLFIIAFIPVAVFAISYLYFVFTKPDFLRSEEHQQRMESMRLLGDKDNPLHAEAHDIVKLITNPQLPPSSQTQKMENE